MRFSKKIYSSQISKSILVLLLSFILFKQSNAQKIDTIINKEVYKSYYSYAMKSPLYVMYYLYQGGGDCSRKKLTFKSEYKSAVNKDYVKSGYDRGHLVNAEDFAFDCDKEKCTFSYYNCMAQHPKLNRGSWKTWEAKIRNESQLNILKIYTGAIYGSNIIGDGVRVPEYCWKVVYNTKTKLITHILLFKNDETEAVQRVTLSQLKNLLQYPIEFNAE